METPPLENGYGDAMMADLSPGSLERMPLHEVQRNIAFSETPELFKPPAVGLSVAPAPPTATLSDLGDDAGGFSFNPPAQRSITVSPVLGEEMRRSASGPLSDWDKFVASEMGSLLLWRDPAVSGLSFFGGGLAVLAVQFLLHGSHGLTWLTGFSYACVAVAAFNFMSSLISHRPRSLAATQLTSAAAAKASDAVYAAARLHDKLLSANDPTLTLKVVFTLWFLAVVGRMLSPWTLVTACFFTAWTLPVAYHTYEQQVNGLALTVKNIVQERWEMLGLTRRQRFGVLGVLSLSAWLNSGWATRLLTLFLALVAVRCQLKPAEVDYIMTSAQPLKQTAATYTQSAIKRARRVSLYAADMARKSLGNGKSKTHVR